MRTRHIVLMIGALAIGLGAAGPSGAQLEGGSLEGIIEEEVSRQIEEQVAEQLTSEAEQQVESQITDAVEEQVQSQVAGAVEEQVQSQVAGAVEEQVQSQIADTVGQQLESQVADAIAQQVQTDVAGEVAQQLQSEVAQAVERQAQSELVQAVERQLESRVGDVLEQDIVSQDIVSDAAAAVVDGLESQALDGVLGGEPTGDASEGNEASGADDTGGERFIASVDGSGGTIEGDVWIVLVPSEHAARIDDWGFTIQERRELSSLSRVLLKVSAPGDIDIAEAALELALDAPGTEVDFNHLYRPSDDGTGTAARPAEALPAPFSPRSNVRMSFGSIDSAVAVDHEALRGAEVVQRDFVTFDGERPLEHGTAVAAILVGSAEGFTGQAPGARLYAASVFFIDDTGIPGATTESLVAALEWLTAEGVQVTTMSLAGPPNRVLEAATAAASADGAVLVAAVGNNGPHGEPRYPAAYEHVIGVTAVDAEDRVYRYANRGTQVAFAAPGVHVRVARSSGGYGRQSGTSMAAPYAAAVIGRALERLKGHRASEVLDRLRASAVDLGPPSFDETFGFGLIVPLDTPSLAAQNRALSAAE